MSLIDTLSSWQIACSILLFALLHLLVEQIFLRFLPATFNKLTRKRQIEWCNRFCSLTHALLSSQCALRCIPDGLTNPITGHCELFSTYFLVSLGYFAYDIGCLFVFPGVIGGWDMLFHHLVTSLAILAYLEMRWGVMFTVVFLSFELTSPFICGAKYLTESGVKDLRNPWLLFFAAGTFASWIVFRLIGGGYLAWLTYTEFSALLQSPPLNSATAFLLVIIFNVLNWYWFYKLVGVALSLSPPSRPSTASLKITTPVVNSTTSAPVGDVSSLSSNALSPPMVTMSLNDLNNSKRHLSLPTSPSVSGCNSPNSGTPPSTPRLIGRIVRAALSRGTQTISTNFPVGSPVNRVKNNKIASSSSVAANSSASSNTGNPNDVFHNSTATPTNRGQRTKFSTLTVTTVTTLLPVLLSSTSSIHHD